MVRNHSLHRDAADEAVRVNALARQSQRQLDRERRRIAALVQDNSEYRDCYGRPLPNEDIARDGWW